VASHRQIEDGHSSEARAATAQRHPIDDSTGVRVEGHASRTVPKRAGRLSGAQCPSAVFQRYRACHPTAGPLMRSEADPHLAPKPSARQRTRGGPQPSELRRLEPAVALCGRRREPIPVSGERGPSGRRDELRHHPFWGARKKGRQKLARRKCRRHETLGENDSNPQISLWVAVLDKSRRRPTLPRGLPLSTIGAGGLNCRVRKGNGCVPTAMATGNLLSRGSTHYGRP
jgi:hypothetical protein